MSNTKIVIDKEDWDKIASEFNSNDLPTVTEIQIDQSIEEKIKSILNKYEPINKGTEYFYNSNSVIESMQEIATSQQIIEQLRVKEKIVLDSNLKIKEKTTVLMEGTYYPNDGFWINGIKVFPDYYTIR